MTTIKTTLHTYNIDTNTPEGKTEWRALRAKLLQGPPCHVPVLSAVWHKFTPLDGVTVELETKHLFNNQWNTAPIERATDEGTKTQGLRVFDWTLEAIWNGSREVKHIKRGHFLEQTDEMREIRRNTVTCGYCGKQEPAAKGYIFCPHCLDSEYLTESDLRMTRMVPVDQTHADNARPDLTQAERNYLLPLYRESQTKGSTERGKTRIDNLRRGLDQKAAKTIASARMERDGLLWLIENGLGQLAANNVIFYKHTSRFCFGWRRPVSDDEKSRILDVISEFRFPYDIKTSDGKTLSGN